MANEFMFYIRNAGDAKASLSAEDHLIFIKQCEVYIEQLKAKGKLIAAQPLLKEGCIISKPNSAWITAAFNIRAYNDSSQISATLIEGHLAVKTYKENNSRSLHSGQQIGYNR